MHSHQTGQQQPSPPAVSNQSGKAAHGSNASTAGPDGELVARRAAERGVLSTGPQGRAIASNAPQGKAAPSNGPQGRAGGDVSSVPDLMTFSPAVSSRPPGLNQQQASVLMHPIQSLQQAQEAQPDASGLFNSARTKAQQQQPGSRLAQSSATLLPAQQHRQAPPEDGLLPAPSLQQPKQATGGQPSGQSQAVGVAEKASTSTALHSHAGQSSVVPDSRTGSPLPGGSFYDNAVFGSPTPTPSPQGGGWGVEHSLLSPGSSPGLNERQPNTPHDSRPAGKVQLLL